MGKKLLLKLMTISEADFDKTREIDVPDGYDADLTDIEQRWMNLSSLLPEAQRATMSLILFYLEIVPEGTLPPPGTENPDADVSGN